MTTTTAPKPPIAELVLRLGDSNNNGKADLSGSLRIGPLAVPLPTIDVDLLDALGIFHGLFKQVRDRFITR